MVSKPCCPSKISRKRVQIPTQSTGVMSTPPRGGINFRVGARKGSVGRATRLQGSFANSSWGYQVKIMRKIKKTVRWKAVSKKSFSL